MARQTRKQMHSKNLRPHEMDIQDNVLQFNKHKRKTADNNLVVKKLQPLTRNQELAFESYDKGKNIVCTGCPGTGKTMILLYFALNDILQAKTHDKLIIVRAAVQAGEKIGALPGTLNDKMGEFEKSYKAMVNSLCNRDDAYELLKKKQVIELVPTSFLRSNSYDNSIILAEEIGCMKFSEISTIVTRVGKNSKIFMNGDRNQVDLNLRLEKSGFDDCIDVIDDMHSFEMIDFQIEDIVRSGICYEWTKICYQKGLYV